MFKIKLTTLLIAIFLLNINFLFSYSVFADRVSNIKGTKFVSRFNFTGNFSLASNPDCGAFKTSSALSAIAIAVSAIFTGLILIISSAGLFTAFIIVGMISTIVNLWKSIGGLVICQHSFVRHPVARNHDGKYKNFKLKNINYIDNTDKNYQTENEYFYSIQEKSGKNGRQEEKEIINFNDWDIIDVNRDNYYWPKNSVRYSEYIEVCHRNPLTFSKLFKSNEEIERDFDVREIELHYGKEGWSPKIDGELICKVLKSGSIEKIYGSTFRALRKIGRLCVELVSTNMFGVEIIPWPQGVDIGCTELPPDPISPMCEKSIMIFKSKDNTDEYKFNVNNVGNNKDYKTIINEKEKEGKVFTGYDNSGCFSKYVSGACYNQSGSKSLAPVPITSMIVQCIKESLDNLVSGYDSNGNFLRDEYGNKKGSFLAIAQKRLKNTISAVLILALILFSLKVISGGVRGIQEMYMLIIKFSLVVYFTTGDTMQYYYRELIKLSNGLSEIVLKASSESKGICNYDGSGIDYESSNFFSKKKVSYSYLAPWDRLDCRILFYLGAPLNGISSKIGTGSIGILSVLLGAAPILLVAGSILGIIFAGGQILVSLVCIFMLVMMMMVILWICYVFILSLIALSVIIILSPLFIPMILFQHTKGYFDGWLKELITYSLYPVMLFTFLSFMFIACDKIYFNGLNFEKEEVKIFGIKKQWFKIKNGECDKNHDTLACMMQNYNFKKSSLLGLFDFSYIEFTNLITRELFKLALILFLFYHFLNVLPDMAAELSGNYRSKLGSGYTPGEAISKVFSSARAITGIIGRSGAIISNNISSKNSIKQRKDGI